MSTGQRTLWSTRSRFKSRHPRRRRAKPDPKNPDRGPLLIIEGQNDHTGPWAIANAAFKRQRQNQAVTELEKLPNRGHSLTIDSGWREVAERALTFVKRFVGGTTERNASDGSAGIVVPAD
jgi:pimeloyl-ACP methyl ester carboxylesterase